ncbi:MAG: GNAT family N-acetyltransferase [Anaerolineales bacterium]|nr:GNAT family N-acetyltransferase [Anaerolineales bacterium]
MGKHILEELSVHPDHGRRGLGQRLLTYGCQWAQAQGYKSVALSTFADVAWNAPFYARLGFEILPQEALTAALLAIQAEETAVGLDIRPRVFMRKTLDASG